MVKKIERDCLLQFCHYLLKLPPLTSIIFVTMEVNGAHQLFNYILFKISTFVFSRRKKFIQVLEQL